MQMTRHDRYLHWTLAAAVLSMLALGVIIDEIPRRGVYYPLRTLHMNLGLAVLLLGLWRLGVRLTRGFPGPLPAQRRWDLRLARTTQWGLILLTIVTPLAGLGMSLPRQVPIVLLGLWELPTLAQEHPGLGELFSETHALAAYAITALILLHVAGALRHHFLLEDDTLRRMLGRG